MSASPSNNISIRVVDWWSKQKITNGKGVSKAKLVETIKFLHGRVKHATLTSYAEGLAQSQQVCVGEFYELLQKDADDDTLPQEVRDYLSTNLQPRIDEWRPDLNIELTLDKDGSVHTRKIDEELMENTPDITIQ